MLQALQALAGDAPSDPIIRALLDRAARRLEKLCGNMLYRSYPRLARPLCLATDELVGAVVERLLKAMVAVHPRTVREFFALANQHVRCELNDLARRLDEQPVDLELREGLVPAPASSGSILTPDTGRILEAIDGLPADERETLASTATGPPAPPRWPAAGAATGPTSAQRSGSAGVSRPASGSGPRSPSGQGRSTSAPQVDRVLVPDRLTHLWFDPDLHGLLDPESLRELPQAERQECLARRREIDYLTTRAQSIE